MKSGNVLASLFCTFPLKNAGEVDRMAKVEAMGINNIICMARAKINLTLDVLGKLANGYHEVKMLMQSLALADEVCLHVLDDVPANTIQLHVDNGARHDAVPVDASNLAWRAAEVFLQIHPQTGGVGIEIKKQIPMAAGLAGGSTDAAATLLGLYDLFHVPLDKQEAYSLGARLGADVPFVMQGGTMLATGRGDVLQRVTDACKTTCASLYAVGLCRI